MCSCHSRMQETAELSGASLVELAGKTLGPSVISKCLVQFLLLQMGKLRPREGKGFAQGHRANWEEIVELNSYDNYRILITIMII